jgi:5-methyltetrahydropteroyltriglutamate--homocysteine methyltransferase
MAPRTTPPFRADLAAAYADEITALAALGCTYLQFDDTLFAFMNDPAWRERAAATGVDPGHQHETNVTVINQALAGRPDGLTVTASVVEGNALTLDQQRAKLDLVVETAADLWGS